MGIVGIILLVLAALLLLLLLCRVGVIATYSADGLTVRARLGWFKLTVNPCPSRNPSKNGQKRRKRSLKPRKNRSNRRKTTPTACKRY